MKSEKNQDKMTSEATESAEETTESQAADNITDDTAEVTEPEVKSVESELAEANDKYMRLAAEFENYKKRTARERMDLIRSSNDNLLLQMLETVDNFERALESAEKGQSDDNPQKLYQSLHEGAKMIHQQLVGVMKTQGVEEIEAKGKEFDPAFHEAVVQIETDEHPENHVSQVISKGYKRGDRVLRHSRVGVAAKKQQQEEE